MPYSGRPTVSIGLPVYNGQNFLAAAIASILEQRFADFELIICDNASTDGTEEICRAFGARDGRIRYQRNPRNLGAGPNFNRAFELARGEYFKWAAHDDLLEPPYLERCVDALRSEPDAVLCHSAVRRIEGERELGVYDSGLGGAGGSSPAERFAAVVLVPHMCIEVFGLIRADALRATALIGSYRGSDRGLLAELALRGRFLQGPEPLFVHRDHAGRFVHGPWYDRAACLAWYDRTLAHRRVWHGWTYYGALWRAVAHQVADPTERLRCYRHLLRWPWRERNLALLAGDLLWGIDPRAFRAARDLRQRLTRRGGAQPAGGLADSR